MVGQTCHICGEEAGKRCGGCLGVYYCSKEHQRLDWLRHKTLCKPFKICSDEVLGRHLVATRDIRAGEVVLREAPLLQGPSQVTGPVCLGCLQGVSEHNSEPCDKCGWPLCRQPACRQAKQHLPECRWAVAKRGTPVKISHFVSPHPSYECITALRMCYTKLHTPNIWSKLSNLQSHSKERIGSQKYKDDTKTIAQFLRRFYKLEDTFTDDEIMEIWGIVQVNGHEVPVTHPTHVAVYDSASMLEHSCHPNCSKSFTSAGDLVIRAVTAIPRDTHLSICYTDCLWGTANRQCHLMETKFFQCKCRRCVDPTELGTYFSALLCQLNNCLGQMLPQDLCSTTSDSLWTCTRCGFSQPDHEVERLLHKAGEELSTLSTRDVSASTGFLQEWATKFHRNHYYMTEVRVALVQRLGQDSHQGVQSLSDEQLKLKTDLCRQLLELLSVVAPGECRLLGVLHFELHASLAECARRSPPSDLHHMLLESRDCLDKAIFWLEQEPEVLPEGQLLRQARVNKSELDKTLQSVHNWATSIPAM